MIGRAFVFSGFYGNVLFLVSEVRKGYLHGNHYH